MFSGSAPRFFENNIIYATVPDLILATSGFSFDANIYFASSESGPLLQIGGTTYSSFRAYQSAIKQDAHSFYIDPMVTGLGYHAVGRPATAFQLFPSSPAIGKGVNVCNGISGCDMGHHDFWENPLPDENSYNIGAYQGR
jgi:hypothetical protein